MLGYIYRLIRSFEQEHGVHPNLLCLNRLHAEYLLASCDETLPLSKIMDILQMEMIVDPEIIHPSVTWTHAAERAAS